MTDQKMTDDRDNLITTQPSATTFDDASQAEPSSDSAAPQRPSQERVQILFDVAAIRAIERLKDRYRMGRPSTAAVIRDALGFYAWAGDELHREHKIVSVDRRGTHREVLLPIGRDGAPQAERRVPSSPRVPLAPVAREPRR